ncbi:uncharacterized protein LAJ45_06363 [Morchella importuna]|uniref:PX domain-containing protein n=1 Tax=Morchella conica CCBAS932 TaxID=1392247 RepID=A0A3N4L3K6_9PEZI|nr:uncharacterized protein LAJ45_06363 [Morchella importuna]KAH8149732.1 hypothetical protein LAJ45_06363 [Morchella importuna]RPB17494.1 hypothetical protein P167DRAFT_531071 [Morchella conica CCBAS932]
MAHPEISSLSINDGANRNNILTGKQEHYLKRELIGTQVRFEIAELNSPTALQRFGAPFRSPLGEVAPVDSELPILRYIFVHHVRKFPFLNQAKEKEFWQDRLQVFLESFANKRISSSEDRLEETKRRKLALKCEKLVELMMNSGIPTASGYEERVGFEEIEAAGGADRAAHEGGLLINVPEGNWINGWDVNIASVRQISVKRTVRHHIHAEFLLRTKRVNQPDVVVGRRYGAFVRLHKELRQEIPGKVLPPLPRKSQSSSASAYLSQSTGDDRSSISSNSSLTSSSGDSHPNNGNGSKSHARSQSLGSSLGSSLGLSRSRNASRSSLDHPPVELWRENQRISLRAFLRALLGDEQIAKSRAITKFLLENPITLNAEERVDEERRRAMDNIRIEEQRRFYEIARQRARELDVYMESFRREIVESNGLTKLFAEIRQKDKLADLSIQYKKFAEWLRIEVAATIYHLFLAEDNSSELFAQGKRIHSLIPYTVLKNVIRIANPAAVMSGVLDLFLATPFGSRSLMQRVLSMAIGDGIKQLQKSIDSLTLDIADPVLCAKLKEFTEADEEVKQQIREDAEEDRVDIIVAILRSEYIQPELESKQIETVFNAYVAWNNAVENVQDDMRASAQLFAHLKQLLKLYTRQRDKNMMLEMIGEPVTLQLFRDLFTIFYEPLIRVYKSANVYNSVTDFSIFIDDMIKVVEKAQNQDMSSDPNQTVQSFIDLCARHENNFYKFVHEVHIHDDGLFENLMGWLEGILGFLRKGPAGGALDMNELMRHAVETGVVDGVKAKDEIDQLIKWQARRRKWHEDKTRQKMATAGEDQSAWLSTGPENQFSVGDFGIADGDLDDLNNVDDDELSGDENESDDQADPIEAERRKRKKKQDHLRRRAGEPIKPVVTEVPKLKEPFLLQLRQVLAG